MARPPALLAGSPSKVHHKAMPLHVDPKQLAQEQIERDRKRCAQRTKLLEIKIERMSASPFAFLRGAAPLFYDLLARFPELAEGPSGEGWLCGDLHLENFGAYRVAAPASDKEEIIDSQVVFDINDFDEAVQGPWRFDVLRLLTSLILATRELRTDGKNGLLLCNQLLEAYTATLILHQPPPARPKVVDALLDKVSKRTRKDLLAARTELHHGERRLIRGAHYLDLPEAIVAEVPAALARYVETLDESLRPPKDSMKLVDAAFRIAGTGSLGALRVAALVRGKGGEDGCWIIDLKEEGPPSAAALCPTTLDAPQRIITAMKAALPHAPRLIGSTRLNDIPMLARRLQPQEDKLDLTLLPASELPALAAYLGALTADVHLRGATPGTKPEWEASHREALIEHAIDLAGCHEAAYLWYCRLAGKS